MASKHAWRGDPTKLDPWREWIKKNIPGGSRGYIFEDLDFVARRFYTEDPIGKFMLIEMKYAGQLAKQSDAKRNLLNSPECRTISTLSDYGLSLDESSRAQKIEEARA